MAALAHTADRSTGTEHIEPLRFAIKVDPPTIVLEYRRTGNPKKRLREFKLRKLKATSNPKRIVRGLQKRCSAWLGPDVVDAAQVQRLVERLIQGLSSTNPNDQRSVPDRAQTSTARANSVPGSFVSKENVSQNEGSLTSVSTGPCNPTVASSSQATTSWGESNDGDVDEIDELLAMTSTGAISEGLAYGSDSIPQPTGAARASDETQSSSNSLPQDMSANSDATFDGVDLNKVSQAELDRAKAKMDTTFLKNQVRPGDPQYEFDKRGDFAASDGESDNSWDEDEDEDDE